MKRRAGLFEMPEIAEGDLLFALKDITYTPEMPRKGEPFTVRGKVELLKIPFLAPIWVTVKVTYPEKWWEEIIPIIGSPTVSETDLVIGGDFEISFPRGFDREGEFLLAVEVYAGPTVAVDTMTLPPFPPVTKEETTFTVGGEIPPEELGFRNFRITGYGKLGEHLVAPPDIVELDIGDTLRVDLGFEHEPDRDISGKFHVAIWQKRPWDPHDEILNAEKAFTVQGAEDWASATFNVDIPITSAISPGTYGLYGKIMGITGGDIFTAYLPDVIKIIGVPPGEADIKDFDFKLTKGTYGMGASVPFTAPYDYKGPEQAGQLTISIGTGSVGAFFEKYTYEPIPVEFPAAGAWETRGLQGNITLPDMLEPGQTYSVRAKLETLTVPTQETDTDWSAFDIEEFETLEVRIDPSGAGYVTTSPAPSGGTQHNWQFPHGATVYVTAHPNAGYRFKSWSGEMTDTTAITTPIYPMTEHRLITAHFEPEIELETLEVRINPYGAGYVTTSPAPAGGVQHNWQFPHGTTVYVTAHPNSGYRFKSWSGEMTDTTAITAPVYPMTEHRLITAHFEPEIELETLEVRIDPPGAGYVTTSPEPAGGVQHNWQFPHGTTVYVTAHPNPGYRFKSWSGEMKDTTAITAPVYPMTEHRLITAHFKEEYVPPPPVEKGTFTVYPYNPPTAYEEWCVEWAPDVGTHYLSSWGKVGEPVTVQGPYGEDVPLVGKMYAWLWPGYGTATKYGPTPRYTLKDGASYNYNIGGNVLYER